MRRVGVARIAGVVCNLRNVARQKSLQAASGAASEEEAAKLSAAIDKTGSLEPLLKASRRGAAAWCGTASARTVGIAAADFAFYKVAQPHCFRHVARWAKVMVAHAAKNGTPVSTPSPDPAFFVTCGIMGCVAQLADAHLMLTYGSLDELLFAGDDPAVGLLPNNCVAQFLTSLKLAEIVPGGGTSTSTAPFKDGRNVLVVLMNR